MFTGIVTAVGELTALEDGPVRRFTVRGPWPAADLVLGASIAHSGVCLTVTGVEAEQAGARYQVEVSPETLQRTTLGGWKTGTQMNLERPLKVGDELGGHIVQGHVDGVGEVLARKDTDGWMALTIEASAELAPFIAEKRLDCGRWGIADGQWGARPCLRSDDYPPYGVGDDVVRPAAGHAGEP